MAEYLEQTQHHPDALLETETPISLLHFSQVLKSYRFVIVISVAAIMFAYAIVAIAAYLFSPARRVSMQPFRLDFKGASESVYPNDAKFNTAEIVSEPVLSRVYRENHLSDYLGYGAFSRSIFVLESNPQYDELVAEYQARLSDRNLSAVDRDAVQKEFEAKRTSIVKNEYAITLTQWEENRRIPETLVRKVLLDTLNDWADFAVNQQRVTTAQVSIPTAVILKPSEFETENLIGAVQVLRGKIDRLIRDTALIAALPGANLARTPSDQISLEEIQVRLEDIVRYRLEPLVPVIFSSGLVSDRAATLRFLQSQLDYDQRQLDGAQRAIDGNRQALAAYEQPTFGGPPSNAASETPKSAQGKGRETAGDSVMPQLSDTFLDRLIVVSGRGLDAAYRQRLVTDYRNSVGDAIPWQQAITYDEFLIHQAQTIPVVANKVDAQKVLLELDRVRAETSALIGTMNELFQVINRNVTPSTQLFTLTATPSTRVIRALSLQRIALYGLFVLLMSIPIVIVVCMLHNRIHEEEADEALTAGSLATPATTVT